MKPWTIFSNIVSYQITGMKSEELLDSLLSLDTVILEL
jgi:hypothetical protein